jgi:arsenate reductase-like glutaredoxin family protein
MDSITIYYKENSGASAKAIKWFEEHHFTINLKKINTITHKEIFQTIYLAELDIPDILRKPKGYSLLLQKKKKS